MEAQRDIIRRRINKRKKAILRRRRIAIITILVILSAISITSYHLKRKNVAVSTRTIKTANRGKKDNNISPGHYYGRNNIISKFVQEQLYKNNTKLRANSFDAGEIQDYLAKDITIKDNRKIAFLTFDDGPSTTVTPKILGILRKNHIKATFFIVGSQVEESPRSEKLLKEIYDEGHAIGNHTYSHDYSKLYPNRTVDTSEVVNEIERTNKIFRRVLGDNFATRVIRLPGGHGSWKGTSKLDKQFALKGYKYIDWNALLGDAERGRKTKQQLIYRYKQTFRGQKDVIILMHDTYGKENTAKALQYVISDLKKKGYRFMVLS